MSLVFLKLRHHQTSSMSIHRVLVLNQAICISIHGWLDHPIGRSCPLLTMKGRDLVRYETQPTPMHIFFVPMGVDASVDPFLSKVLVFRRTGRTNPCPIGLFPPCCDFVPCASCLDGDAGMLNLFQSTTLT